ncbi:hypothetical protein Ancab_018932 [Ancistrocladus abbreviatus]
MAAELRELRHSSSMGNRASSSPRKQRDDDQSPFLPDHKPGTGGDDDHLRHPRDHRPFWSHFQYVFPCSSDDSRVSNHSSRISLSLVVIVAIAALISIFSLVHRLSAPYLCNKDGIVLHCPRVMESPSLWENPYSATTSWKPCAERRSAGISDLPPENETNGYIFIHAEGGLNQQRIAICNAVAVAKVMNATLILPVLKQDQIWKDQTKFEDIFDVDHFIDYLKDDVRIVRDIPDWFLDKSELFTSISLDKQGEANLTSLAGWRARVRPSEVQEAKFWPSLHNQYQMLYEFPSPISSLLLTGLVRLTGEAKSGIAGRTVKNIPKYASAQFYIDNVLPRIKEKKIMSLKPFVDRLG